MMKTILGSLVVAVLLTGCASVPEVDPELEKQEWGTQRAAAEPIYAEAMELLSGGRQQAAELLLEEACETMPDCQRLLFLKGTMARSRFENGRADQTFVRVHQLGKMTVPGRAALAVVALDSSLLIEPGFITLDKILNEHPDEILVRWIYCMEARFHKIHVKEAEHHFEAILSEWKTAPAMLHCIYGRLLTSELDEPEKALEHRMLAAEMEPGPLTYEGLANTFLVLKRYDDADRVYAKLLEMSPDSSIDWLRWGNTMFFMEAYDAAAEKYAKAQALDPRNTASLVFHGLCLQKSGRLDAGFKKYEQALAVDPSSMLAKAFLVHSHLYGCGTEPDFEGALEQSAELGMPGIDALRKQVRSADESANPLVPEKSAVLLKHLTALGEQGNPAAQYNLAMIYRYGIGVKADKKAAAGWLKRAAASGHAIPSK
jgi:tetratricopeptide (TPR) repeat protein